MTTSMLLDAPSHEGCIARALRRAGPLTTSRLIVHTGLSLYQVLVALRFLLAAGHVCAVADGGYILREIMQ